MKASFQKQADKNSFVENSYKSVHKEKLDLVPGRLSMGSKYKGVKVPEPVLKERRSSRHSVNTSRKSDKDVSLQKIPKSLGKESESYNVI